MTQTGSILMIFAVWSGLSAGVVAGRAAEPGQTLTLAANAQGGGSGADKGSGAAIEPEMTPGQKMQARFPQPAKVSHLIGLPVLDGKDSTIGYVQQVVRAPDDKIQLIVPYRRRFGWARNDGLFGWGRRLVAVPIEVVAILALQINAVDMDRDAFDKAPTWVVGQGEPIPSDQTVRIALGRR